MSPPGEAPCWNLLKKAFELLLTESSEDDRKIFLEEIGLQKSGLDTLIERGYKTLDLSLKKAKKMFLLLKKLKELQNKWKAYPEF